jgi:hypothetical protein
MPFTLLERSIIHPGRQPAMSDMEPDEGTQAEDQPDEARGVVAHGPRWQAAPAEDTDAVDDSDDRPDS